jgi:hypothetical protein
MWLPGNKEEVSVDMESRLLANVFPSSVVGVEMSSALKLELLLLPNFLSVRSEEQIVKKL